MAPMVIAADARRQRRRSRLVLKATNAEVDHREVGAAPPDDRRRLPRAKALIGLAVMLALGVALAACSTTADPETETAVAEALSRELGVPDDEVRCLTEALVQQVDIDDLRQRGLGAASAPEDPLSGMVSLAPTAAGRCTNLEDRLVELIDHVGGRVERDCVEPDDLDVWPLVGVLLQPVGELGDLDDLPGQATVQLVDAVRACVDPSTLARLAGLDDPTELERVLIADPFARSRLADDQDACVITATIEAIGVERLAEIGVDLDQPDLFTVRARIDDGEIAALVDAFATCDLDRQLLRAISITDEQIAPCILDGIEPEATLDLVSSLYDGVRIVDDPTMSRRADQCATIAVRQRFPDAAPGGISANPPVGITSLARPYLYLWTASGRYEQACLQTGLETITADVSAGLVERAIEAAEQGVLRNPASSAAERAYLADVNEVLTTCVRPWPRLLPWLWSAGVDPHTFDCVRSVLDDDLLRSMMESYGPAVWEGDTAARQPVLDGLAATGEAIAACTSAADVDAWRTLTAPIAS